MAQKDVAEQSAESQASQAALDRYWTVRHANAVVPPKRRWKRRCASTDAVWQDSQKRSAMRSTALDVDLQESAKLSGW